MQVLSENKINFSLLGNTKKGIKRFLYDAYLPFEHSNQGVRFCLTPDKQKLMFQKVKDLGLAATEILKPFFNNQVWPLDSYLILRIMHCYVNADERIKCLMEKYSPSELTYHTMMEFDKIKPSLLAAEYLSRCSDSRHIYEQIMVYLLELRGVEIKYRFNDKNINFTKKAGIFKQTLKSLAAEYRYRKYFIKHKMRRRYIKPLVLTTKHLSQETNLADYKDVIDLIELDQCIGYLESKFSKEMSHSLYLGKLKESRQELLNAFNNSGIPEVKQIAPFLARNYPVSLLEGRKAILQNIRHFFKKASLQKDKNLNLLIDHSIWKKEIFSALAHECINYNGRVFSKSHDPVSGFCDYSNNYIVEQYLITHYLTNFKEHFPYAIGNNPAKVIQVDLLKKSHYSNAGASRKPGLNIYFFPHHQPVDPGFSHIFHGVEHPESYFDNQKAILQGLAVLAGQHKINEIVIKLRPTLNEMEKDKYYRLIEQVFNRQMPPKFKIAENMFTCESLKYASVAVHDMFSSGFVETMQAKIPTFAMISREASVPQRLIDREYWIKAGVFVHDAQTLAENILACINGKKSGDYEIMRERFLQACGLGSPEAGYAVKTILAVC